VVGREEEFAAMAPAHLTSRVVRVSADPPMTPSQLRNLAGSALDLAARTFAVEPVDVLGYASTSIAEALGFIAEAAVAVVSRLSALVGVPAESTCSSGAGCGAVDAPFEVAGYGRLFAQPRPAV
jgi:maleate cis-trans isomerase